MQTIEFSILIKADKRKVWSTLFDDKTYREWTKPFHPGSYFEGSWTKGSEIRFLAPNEEGKLEGMYSRIKESDLHRFMSVEHLGMIRNGIVDTTSEEVKKWAPSLENYTLTERDNKTELKVDMQIEESYKSIFEVMWPKALDILKTLCER